MKTETCRNKKKKSKKSDKVCNLLSPYEWALGSRACAEKKMNEIEIEGKKESRIKDLQKKFQKV